jgi:isopenicillin N synthase-like dioxygenase
VFYGGARDQKESFDLCFESPDGAAAALEHPFSGANVWPDLPGFKAAVSGYYGAVFELGRTLLRGFALALDLPETFFDRFVTAPPSQLRMLHYPPNPAPEVTVGIGAHTDYECFTILLPTASGLEVMNGAGEWIDAPPRPGAFVVNIGDTLEMWTNGELTATSHRVRKLAEERFAFPLFFSCDYAVEVAPLPQFVGPERPSRYPPVKAGEHLYAQTVQSFTYLKERLARGELRLPEGARPMSSFGQEGKAIYEQGDG